MSSIIITVIVLGVLALIFAAIIFIVEKFFKVEEDPRIDSVAEVLPGANCGGCGFAGCRNLAENIVKSGELENYFCPVGGNETMSSIAKILGIEVSVKEPQIAVVRCNGSFQNSPLKTKFEGISSCAFANNISVGQSGCPNSCLGLGDCAAACSFNGITISTETGLPIIDEDICVACGSCMKACPRNVIELRNKGLKNRRVYVSCQNTEKGAVAKKNCSVACIGCGKCAKVCPFEAITVENNKAYIDFTKCKLCKKCVAECPTGAIHAVNFPEKKDTKIEDNTEA